MGVAGAREKCAALAAFAVVAAWIVASPPPAIAQNPTNDSATAGDAAPRLGCLYEQLPTAVKLRFELSARVGPEAATDVLSGPRGLAFAELLERCGFTADGAGVALAEIYWAAQATRSVAAVEADRAGLNVDTLEIALLASGPVEALPTLAEELMRGEPAADDGPAAARVVAAIEAYQGATDVELTPEQVQRAAGFVAADIIVQGLDDGADPFAPTTTQDSAVDESAAEEAAAD